MGLWRRLTGKGPAVLEAIFLSPAAGKPMQAVDQAEAGAGGLVGDRYATGEGFWQGPDACSVTLIRAEDLEQIQHRNGLALASGEHRRNLVVRGLPSGELTDGVLALGDVRLLITGPRPPCGHLERLTQRGMVRALRKSGGASARIIQPGTLRVGTPIHKEPT